MTGDVARSLAVVDHWYATRRRYQHDLPSKGSVGAAVHLLGRLRADYDLDIRSHVAAGQAQVAGLSVSSLAAVLAEFGERRVLSSIAGRTNRGARGDLDALLQAMPPLDLASLPPADRDAVLRSMQARIVTVYVPAFFAAKPVKVAFDPGITTQAFIRRVLDAAGAAGKLGPVLEYLVGAKLALRFPTIAIRNKRSSVADDPSGHSGDFEVRGTVFHVTAAPMPELLAKCRRNLDDGLRVYVVVPDSQALGARQNAELLAPGRIAVVPAETFIATNVDEMAEFDAEGYRSGLRRLLDTYHDRVDAVELDKSLLIVIPPNLK